MAKTAELERTYNIPLRKEFQKVPRWKKTKKAVTAVKQFLQKHMKSDNVKLGTKLNEEMWKHGIRNPPHHVKVTVTKDKKGVVKAELFGTKTGKKEEKKAVKKEVKAKKEIKEKTVEKETKAKEPVKKEEAKVKKKAPVKEEKAEAKEEAPAEKAEKKKE